MPLSKVISGGQTGVDRGALDAALALNFPCGGWCPANRKAEDGRIPDRYPVVELPGAGYEQRTRQNVIDSNGTLILYFSELSGGTLKTFQFCERQHKPVLKLDCRTIARDEAVKIIIEFVQRNEIASLNVAGPRQSKVPEASASAHDIVSLLLRRISNFD